MKATDVGLDNYDDRGGLGSEFRLFWINELSRFTEN